jgi:hypothetical protein
MKNIISAIVLLSIGYAAGKGYSLEDVPSIEIEFSGNVFIVFFIIVGILFSILESLDKKPKQS